MSAIDALSSTIQYPSSLSSHSSPAHPSSSPSPLSSSFLSSPYLSYSLSLLSLSPSFSPRKSPPPPLNSITKKKPSHLPFPIYRTSHLSFFLSIFHSFFLSSLIRIPLVRYTLLWIDRLINR